MRLSWSRLAVTGNLLCLDAWETLLADADRLQHFPCQVDQLKQRMNVQPWSIIMVKFGGGCFRHPNRDVEALTARRNEVVCCRWPLPTLADPQQLARQGVQRVVDLCTLRTGILL